MIARKNMASPGDGPMFGSTPFTAIKVGQISFEMIVVVVCLA